MERIVTSPTTILTTLTTHEEELEMWVQKNKFVFLFSSETLTNLGKLF